MAQNIPDLLTVSLLEGEDHHVLVVMTSAADLQWTTMGLLSVLRCTLLTSSTTMMWSVGRSTCPESSSLVSGTESPHVTHQTVRKKRVL